MTCIVCGSTNQELIYKGIKDLEYGTYKPVDYYECKNCNLIFQNPLPRPDELERFYPAEYRNYLPQKESLFSFLKNIQFQNLARKVSKYFDKNSKILEIGFGNGQLLLALKTIGCEKLYGCDFTNNAFSHLKDKDIKLAACNIEERFPFTETFDVIIMNNVIEHFLDPISVLNNCKNNLSTNGKIILITPNSTALELSIFKKYWAGFHAPRHTYIFNEKNLGLLAKNLGFKDLEVTPETDPGQWSISIQNIFQDSNLTKTKLQNGMSWYLLPLSLMFSPLAIAQNFVRKSTSILCTLKS